jgi:hypothetical protein
METEGHQSHYVKRVILPSGKAIEVVYFDRAGEDAATVPAPVAKRAPAPDAPRLHVCPDCESELVYPVEWEEAGPEGWKVARRCPDCEWFDSEVFSQDQVDAFDDALDRGTEALTKDLRRLMRANMADEIDLFVKALHADAILPEDF